MWIDTKPTTTSVTATFDKTKVAVGDVVTISDGTTNTTTFTAASTQTVQALLNFINAGGNTGNNKDRAELAKIRLRDQVQKSRTEHSQVTESQAFARTFSRRVLSAQSRSCLKLPVSCGLTSGTSPRMTSPVVPLSVIVFVPLTLVNWMKVRSAVVIAADSGLDHALALGFQADVVVGEVNYGGAMVRQVIQTARPNTNYKAVTASRGKVTRCANM